MSPGRPPSDPLKNVRATVLANPVPPLTFPEELPVSALRDEIGRTILANQVVIVCGETGSGKTTQLPKICLSLGRGLGAGGSGLIGHTQPRRIAASATARRIAEELGTPLGEIVGFKVRFHDRLSKGASVKLMTDGILLAETQSDPLLLAYDTIIIDEAHERSLNIDFLLGYLKQLLPRRPDLKVIVTSATIDATRFAEHFATNDRPAPIVEVSGRLYSVEIRYRPVDNGEPNREIGAAILDAVDELCALGTGGVLVFLPGEREIREVAEMLRLHHPPHTQILPLFARLSSEEQEQVFRTSSARRIVLATNVAETSLTVPGIRYVVDSGLARVKRYSYRSKVEQLQIEPIAQASANQRAGRCGRVAAGVCIRLFEEADFNARPPFADPEIMRSSLASVILRMKSLHLGDVEEFPFVERPAGRAISDGYQLLAELGAVDAARELTPIGSELARLPLDPRVGRMILAARDQDCLREVLVIASALSVQDPRDRPIELQAQADAAHKQFANEKSEFLSSLKLWDWFSNAITHKKSNRQLRDLCRSQFLSQMRLREWRDVHGQLATTVAELGWRDNQLPAAPERIHMALLAGLLGNIGMKAEAEAHYLGAHGIKFFLWPGSTLLKKAGRWIMCAELVETTRLYGRTVAQIDPEWLEKVGAHLIRRSYGDPHWEKKAARVTALERGVLHGLMIYGQRRVDFGRLDPVLAREIFIRDGLVAGMRDDSYEPRSSRARKMIEHNRRLVREIEQLEHKTRRPDVLVDDALIVAICEEAIPAEVVDGTSFERWYDASLGQQPRLLYLDRDELMRHDAAGVTTDQFPKTMLHGGIEMALTYHFEPGSVRDGVTLTVPLYALNQVDLARCDWLVAGMLREKVQLLLKSLPQKLRRHCVPLPAYAEGFCERNLAAQEPLIEALVADLRGELALSVTASDFKEETLQQHQRMNFKVIDEHGRQLAMGRNLSVLRAELGGAAQRQFQEAFGAATRASSAISAAGNVGNQGDTQTPMAARAGAEGQERVPALLSTGVEIVDWSFGVLPEIMEVSRNGQTLIGYPALVDRERFCEIEVFDDPLEASRIHRQGLRRLFLLQLREPVRFLERNLPGFQQMTMQFMSLGSADELRDQLVLLAIDRACMAEPLPEDRLSFEGRVQEARSRLGLLANEIARLLGAILTEYVIVQKKLALLKPHAQASADVEAQLRGLFVPRFILTTQYDRLSHYPRYLKAIVLRIEKLRADPPRDARLSAEMGPLIQNWSRALAARKGVLDSRLIEFRWLLEELRVALFAQELRTPMPVSVKRLQKVWQSLQS